MALTRPLLVAALFLAFAFALPSCARVMPVPGGTDADNEAYFKSVDDLKEHIAQLRPGMKETEVFSRLGRDKKDFLELDPEDVWRIALSRGAVSGGKEPDAGAVTGYRLRYRIVTRHHGMASPIRIQTDESGFSYELTLLFRNGNLLGSPILSGGAVNEVRTHTLFDYLTPGTAFSYVRR